MNFLQQTFLWFNELPQKRKVNLLLGISAIISFAFLGIWWLWRPVYGVLFSHLETQDSAKIIRQLEEAGVAYKVGNNGNELLVDRDIIASTRLKVIGSGIPLNGNVGFELFDKNDFGMTDFSQKINYQRALQGELERTIASLDEVTSVRVHLVLPEHHLFQKDESLAKAAVTLHLKHRLSLAQVLSIQQLITASIPKLQADKVVILDQNGSSLSHEKSEGAEPLGAKKKIEHYLSDKVTQLLIPLFDRRFFIVKVDAVINYDELERELIKPQHNGLVTHEKEIKHHSAGKKAEERGNQEIISEKSYELGREKELFKRARGTIERLTISVILPQNTPAHTLNQVAHLVESTVGFNKQRGDTLNIAALIPRPAKTIDKEKRFRVPAEKTFFTSFNAFYTLLFIALLGALVIFITQRVRLKKRKLLLLELTHWLSHHE